MRRLSFLTVFLGCLAVAFVFALVIRLRSYQRDQTTTPGAVTTESGSGPSASAATSTHQSSTVMVVGAAAASEQAINAATASERARLREELMRQPIAPGASRPVGPSPGSTPATVGAQKAPPRQAATQPSGTAVARPSTSGTQAAGGTASHSPQTTTETSGSKEPKDPNSDVAPPQLVSVEFDPPQVQDGQEARIFLTVVDDMSGVRGISGTVTSPNGKALQGFAAQREGESNRYAGRFVIPKNGEEGVWRANVITLSDFASNTATVTAAQGTIPPNAGLRVVSSQSDSTPPVLKGARAEKRAMHVGEANPIYIEAEDDKSGVNLVTAVLQSPGKKARIGAGCVRGDADTWRCEMAIPSCIDCGDWQLEQITLQDKANNLATFRIDNPMVAAVKINIGGNSCDSEAPRLLGILLDQTVIGMAGQPVNVTVTMNVSDDACGVEGVSAQYSGPGTGTGGFVSLQRGGDELTWVGKIPLDPRAPRGIWRLTSVQLTDKGHNLRIYYGSDPLLGNATFQVR